MIPEIGAGFYEPERRFSVEKGNGRVLIRPVHDGDLPAESSEWAAEQVAVVIRNGWLP